MFSDCSAKRFRVFLQSSLLLFAVVGVASFTQAAAKSEAYLGQPFGVGKVTIDVLRGEPVLPLSDERFTLLEAQGRVMYPVLKQEPVRRFLRGLLDMDAPRKVTIYYLFAGDDPFELSAFTPYEQGIRVTPQSNASAQRRLLDQWWEQYTKNYHSVIASRAYPPVAENFLVTTLGRRLGLKIPEPKQGLFGTASSDENPLDYLLVNEAHRLRVDREMLSESPSGAEPVELPTEIVWKDSELPDDGLDEVVIEQLAKHVPEECFYVRFGNFTNYLWFRDLNKKWQGDLGNMILQRGIVRGSRKRIQQQLSLKDNALAKILGPKVIGDAAMIGLDPYVEQGAAIGLIFQAKNEFLLAADLLNQRRQSLTKFEDATEESIEIEGKQVSVISNPTGEVRSLHVQSEGVHLVTTSRTLVERFLQAGKGKNSLADLPSFRRARRELPPEREDSLFAFVSERFWQNLGSVKYVVENSRRMRSTRESDLLELARYAAQTEMQPAASTDELIATGILPAEFATRHDGSTLQAKDGELLDSRRGGFGYFVPIADMEVEDITPAEAAHYQRIARVLQRSGPMPPIAAAVHRHKEEASADETITVEVLAQGSLREKLGKASSWIGQTSQTRLQPVAGDVLAVEAVVEFPGSLADDGDTEQHVFGALRDYRSPLAVKRGAIQPDAPPAELVRGYLGAWPKPGLLQWLTGGEQPEGPEPQPAAGDIWQAKQEDILLLSFKPDVIQQVLPQINRIPAERPAQAWIRLENLTGTQLSETVSALGYMRTRDTSAAASRMMNSLANQLRVPRPECKDFAERLIDGTFVCPLGGEYELYEPKRGLEVWVSSALPDTNRFLLTEVPADFQLPMLHWFRGLQGDICLEEQALRAHFEINMSADALP